MPRRLRWIMVVTGICLAAAAWYLGPSPAQEPSPKVDESDRRMFMHGKLKMVHQVVDGIATEDFDLVKKGALQLAQLSESATFQSSDDPFYKHYSANFEYAVRNLIKAAESDRVERTTFAYVHVTYSCTACHQHVRGTKRVAQ